MVIVEGYKYWIIMVKKTGKQVKIKESGQWAGLRHSRTHELCKQSKKPLIEIKFNIIINVGEARSLPSSLLPIAYLA